MNKFSPKLLLITTLVLLLAVVLPVSATSDTINACGKTTDCLSLANTQLLANQTQTPFKGASNSLNDASVTKIDFEKASDGSPLKDMQLLTNELQSKGVIFSGARILKTGGSLNSPGYPPLSGVNVVDSPAGSIIVTFSSTVSSVNVYYWSVYNIYLDAYDKNNKLIQTKTGAPDTTGYTHGPTMYNLAINNQQGITKVVIRGIGQYFAIDDFSFTPDVTSPVVKIITPSNGSNFYISATPQMPTISFKAQVTGATPTSVSWKGVLSDTWTSRNVNTGATFPASQTFTFYGNDVGSTWRPNFGSIIIGGNLKVTVTATVNGHQYQDSITVHVLGTNPSINTVKAHLGDYQHQVVGYWESLKTWRQFNAFTNPVGTPIFGPPAGYGIMQLDPVPSYKDRWNWITNVNDGVSYFNTCLSQSRGVTNYFSSKYQGVTALTDQQVLTQAYYFYNAGTAYTVKGNLHMYYVWDAKKHNWIQNPNANKNGVAYASNLMQIYNSVISGKPPKGWN